MSLGFVEKFLKKLSWRRKIFNISFFLSLFSSCYPSISYSNKILYAQFNLSMSSSCTHRNVLLFVILNLYTIMSPHMCTWKLWTQHTPNQGTKFIALADYNAMGTSEVSMKEGAEVLLLKVGCAGWVLVKKLGRFYGLLLFLFLHALYLE